MSDNDKRDVGPAILMGLAAAVAGFIPATGAYVGLRQIFSPQRHAEEAMGRGLEAIFFGGPVLTLLFAIAIGWATWRFGQRIGAGSATLALIAAAAAAYVMVQTLPL